MDAATRTKIRFRRSEIMRKRMRRHTYLPITHKQMVAEVEAAIAFSQSGFFKNPVCRASSNATTSS